MLRNKIEMCHERVRWLSEIDKTRLVSRLRLLYTLSAVLPNFSQGQIIAAVRPLPRQCCESGPQGRFGAIYIVAMIRQMATTAMMAEIMIQPSESMNQRRITSSPVR